MKLLALDTSTDTCSVALRVGETVLVRRHPGAREQTAAVLPLVQALLAEAGVTLRELDAIACAHGPGAFTGVRVAVSVVQGLAYGAQVPAIGISTLAALAQQAVRVAGEKGVGVNFRNAEIHSDPFFVLPALDARMGELYAGAYTLAESGLVNALAPDRLVRPEDLVAGLPALPVGATWTVIGSGWKAYPDLAQKGVGVNFRTAENHSDPFLQPFLQEPDALDVLALAARALARGETLPPDRLLPVYLRDTVAWKKIGEQGKSLQAGP